MRIMRVWKNEEQEIQEEEVQEEEVPLGVGGA